MPPKNTKNPGAELLKNFAAHLEASTKAHECAQRQVECQEAGDVKGAEHAEQEAREWLRKAMAIERKFSPRAANEG